MSFNPPSLPIPGHAHDEDAGHRSHKGHTRGGCQRQVWGGSVNQGRSGAEIHHAVGMDGNHALCCNTVWKPLHACPKPAHTCSRACFRGVSGGERKRVTIAEMFLGGYVRAC